MDDNYSAANYLGGNCRRDNFFLWGGVGGGLSGGQLYWGQVSWRQLPGGGGQLSEGIALFPKLIFMISDLKFYK